MADDNIDMDQKSGNLIPNTEQIQEPEIGLNLAENGENTGNLNYNESEHKNQATPYKRFFKIYTIIYGIILGMVVSALLLAPQQCKYQDTIYTEGFAGGERYEFIITYQDFDSNENMVQKSVTRVVEDFNSCAQNNQFKPTFPAYEPYIGEIGAITLLIGIIAMLPVLLGIILKSNYKKVSPPLFWTGSIILYVIIFFIINLTISGWLIEYTLFPAYISLSISSFLLYQKFTWSIYKQSLMNLLMVSMFVAVPLSFFPYGGILLGVLLSFGPALSLFAIWSLFVIILIHPSEKKKKLENIPTENKI